MASDRIDISVNVHMKGATFSAARAHHGGVAFSISGTGYPHVALFASNEDMRRMAEEILAYVGPAAQAEAA